MMKVKLGDLLDRNELLCSILLAENKEISAFQLKKLTRNDLKILKNEHFAKTRPYGWLRNAVETVVSDISGIPIKQVSAHLCPNDVFYILYKSHIYNFGTEIKDIKFRCPHCGQESIVGFDLKEVDVDIPEEGEKMYSTDTFIFHLEDPIQYSFKDVPYVIREIEFKHFVLADTLRHESSYKPNGLSNFTELVYSECIQRIITEDGTEFVPPQAKMMGLKIISLFSAKDFARLEGQFSNRPGVSNYMNIECPSCSMPSDFASPFFYLFPQRL
jgi:DNA-directed RNA polymerase subunit RPC12/RpoP